jgi:hypothetical protein
MSGALSGLSDQDIDTWFDQPAAAIPGTFQLALVLGGTGSSGAYTAGVLDFLIEALDRWDAARGTPGVPGHRVLVRFVTGTSGGGVNAAILSRALAYDFPPVSQSTPATVAAGNPFYDNWVNQLTLNSLLTTTDIDAPHSVVTSILNGGGIDAAADKVVAFAGTVRAVPRAWVAAPLRVFLTLSNLVGLPYKIDFGPMRMADGSTANLQQSYVNHADFARFAFVYPGQAVLAAQQDGVAPTDSTVRPDEFTLCFGSERMPNALPWTSFETFAMATAAIPVGLPARLLSRPLVHYKYRVVAIPGDGTATPARPYQALTPDYAALQDWPGSGGGIPSTYAFYAVDGGVTDNEPIELARTALAGLTGRNPRAGATADRAVLLVDPFAGGALMGAPLSQPSVVDFGGALVGTVLQQTRYDTRDIVLAAAPDVFSRFMITAQRNGQLGDPALATSGLGALIGFACSDFMRHDYMLGRKNCQDYLRDVFVLDATNPIMAPWAAQVPPPALVTDGNGVTCLPIIPLIGDCAVAETLSLWPVGACKPEQYRIAIEARYSKLVSAEFATGLVSDILSWFAEKLTQDAAADFVIGKINDALTSAGLQGGG